MKSTIGSFCITKNEITWIQAHIDSWLPHLDEMVFHDGNSTDGTLEVLLNAAKRDSRVKVFENQDPRDLKDDYVRVFNDCLHALSTDLALFIHPDMVLDDPGNIRNLGDSVAYYSNMRSFCGEPDGQLYEFKEGRTDKWKNVFRLRNPDLGLHYWGHYGASDEDCYFSKITGKEHKMRHDKIDEYPYEVADSKIKILHYSDVRTHERRLSRMMTCLKHQGVDEEGAKKIAEIHPRVTLKEALDFKMVPAEYHPLLKKENQCTPV